MIHTQTSGLPADLDAWRKQVTACATKYRSVAWELIDCLRDGMDRFGEEAFWQVAEDTGLSHRTLDNYLSLGNTFPISRRRENVALGIHETIRTLEPDQQETVLDCCDKFGWDRAQVRDRMRAYKAGDETAWDPRWKPCLEPIETKEPPQGPQASRPDAEQPGAVRPTPLPCRATPFETLCEAWNEAPQHVRRAFVQENHSEIASLLAGIGGGDVGRTPTVQHPKPEPEAPHRPGTISMPVDLEEPELPASLDRRKNGLA